ncbi:hypothetical protein, partial [Methylomagnum sp.]
MFRETHQHLVRAAFAILAEALLDVEAADKRVAEAETSPVPALKPIHPPTQIEPDDTPAQAGGDSANLSPENAAPLDTTAPSTFEVYPSAITVVPPTLDTAGVFFQRLPWPTRPAAPTSAETGTDAAARPGVNAQVFFQALSWQGAQDSGVNRADPGLSVADSQIFNLPERGSSASLYFQSLPWNPSAIPRPTPSLDPSPGLGAAIMRAATHSALAQAQRLTKPQPPPVPAARFFQTLPWRNQD